MTEAQKAFRQMLLSRQIEWYRLRRQMPIGQLIADVACHEARLIVEIDGGQHESLSEEETTRTRSSKTRGTACCSSGKTGAGQPEADCDR
jgi:very-short-patch-repair endonuclease